MSRGVRLLLAVLSALLLIAVLAWAWLWHSYSGRAFVLAQARAALADGTLRWDSAAGTLAGGVQLRGVVFSSNGLQVQIAQAQLALAPSAIWRGVVRLDPLQLRDVQVELSSTSEDAAGSPFVWPANWSALPLPLTIEVPALSVRTLHFQHGTQPPLPVLAIDGGVRIASDQVRFSTLTIRRADDSAHIDGRIALGAHGAVALTLDGASAAEAATAWQLQARITGNPADLQLVLDGRAPGALSARARVRRDGDRLRWQLTARAQDIAPALFGGPEGRFGAALDIDGSDASARVSGQLQRDAQVLRLLPSQIAWQDQQIVLSPLLLSALGGEVRIAGTVGVGGTAPVMALRVEGDALHWGSGGERVAATGSAQVSGTLGQWQLDGKANLRRQAVTAQIALRAHGDQQRAALDQLLLTTDAGQSQLDGELVFSPTVRWQTTGTIKGFDPGFFVADFPGALSAEVASSGAIANDRARFTVDLTALRGDLRGRAITGDAHLGFDSGRSTAALNLRVGSSHLIVDGQHDAHSKVPLSLQMKFAPWLLADLLPEAHGKLVGELALSGDFAQFAVRGEVRGERLSWRDAALGALRLRASPSASGSQVALVLEDVSHGAVHLDQLQVDASGTLAQAEWSLHANAATLSASAAGNWEHGKTKALLAVRSLSLVPTQGEPWALAAPATLRLDDVATLSALCLAQAQSTLCAHGTWPGEAQLSAQAFDLALLDPLLSRDDVAFGFDGDVDGEIMLRSNAARVTQGNLRLRVSAGALQVLPRGKQPAFAWRAMAVDGTLEDDQLRATLAAQTGTEGELRGQFSTGLSSDSPLAGALNLDVTQLAWLELFSPDLAAPSGRLHGQLTLTGSRAAPKASGQLMLADFAAELPALGITLTDSHARLDASSAGDLHLQARLNSGDGPLLLVADGELASADTFTAQVSGEHVKLVDNADLRAWISPDLTISHNAQGLAISGRLGVPEAHIALDKMQAGAAARSPDVVVVDPLLPERSGTPLAISLNVDASFGKAVVLGGFGLDGKLAGELGITQAPGREPLGTGTLNVSGSYERYGKPLTIRHARLSYTRTPLDNPALDIRAERSIDAQMVGVQVSGSALRPITTLVSNPALDNSETLSWLVLGRPLRSAQQADSAKLDAAASALGAGGNLLAEQLGARLGLDEAAVGESRTLGENTLSVGKFVSPRLYVSYGVSLLGVGQVVALKYLLGGGFEVEIESGLESRGSINWRTEH